MVWFWHGEGQEHVTWALRYPSNAMREFYSLCLLTGETGVPGGASGLPLPHTKEAVELNLPLSLHSSTHLHSS